MGSIFLQRCNAASNAGREQKDLLRVVTKLQGLRNCSGYCIEMYEDPAKYEYGVQDENYYSELWIPAKKK